MNCQTPEEISLRSCRDKASLRNEIPDLVPLVRAPKIKLANDVDQKIQDYFRKIIASGDDPEENFVTL